MTAVTDLRSVSYLARRGVSAQWRGFLQALIETLDANLDTASRDALLLAVGARLGGLMPLPSCASLGELETRMNEALAGCDWGWVEVSLDPQDRSLVLTHSAAPSIAAGTEANGAWIAAVLEGLYGAWLGGQPGADAGLSPRRVGGTSATVTLRYGRG
ncbi:cellulose biosynthesis protein BcsD [Paracraurococcus lichenis]|uniref:Cellulose biosynthesis protein BcsD n=1 Tax=Paracraurococcus lichenis TaxID=3064888 RepID=A0ABT9DW10_9PROT|nr:cellulose biosynthesis protein BcsD [Paracraurococcus sp. LOR1-02]MDO9708073.1 cellulose biosynthesis protein BcsD [Paracraurococcus sp. LOR1-02]